MYIEFTWITDPRTSSSVLPPGLVPVRLHSQYNGRELVIFSHVLPHYELADHFKFDRSHQTLTRYLLWFAAVFSDKAFEIHGVPGGKGDGQRMKVDAATRHSTPFLPGQPCQAEMRLSM